MESRITGTSAITAYQRIAVGVQTRPSGLKSTAEAPSVVHEIDIQTTWVAHTWPLFAMYATVNGRTHRKMRDVCATDGVRDCLPNS